MGVRGVFYRQASWPPIRRIRLVAYGASLESWLGASPHGFESHILREPLACLKKTNEQVSFQDTAGEACTNDIREADGRRFFANVR